MSNLRQSLNIFGDQISLGSTLGLRTSFPATGATNVALSSYRNYINAYSPLLCLDANIYTPGSGSWTDQSGNGYNFTVNDSAYSSFNGINYMNFTSTSATITTGTNIPLTFANGATFIAFSEILNNTANYRTLFSGIGGDPHVIINSGTNTLGVLDQTSATGFYGASTPTPGAFTITSIPSFNTNFNMLVLQQKTSSPYFQVKYNGQSGNNYYTNTTNSAAQLKSGLGYIGGVANAQNWGNVGLVLVYNSILTNNQISDIYNRFAARFIYNMPPVTNGMIGYYTGESWTGTQWTDLSGANNATTIVNTANISLYNNIRKDSNGTSYQALNGFNYLAGAKNSGITFPVSLNNYTIIWVARYAGINLQTGSGAGAIGRIFDGQQATNNWLSGFYNGFSGVAEHNGTFITQNTQSKYGSNWIIGVDQTNLFRANGTNLTLTNPSATYNNFNMTINNGNYLATQPSDWMVATVIIYNRELSLSEILTMETWLATKYNLTSSLVSHQLNKISALGSQACVGAYGLYRLSITYTGPTIKVVRSDGIAMDFYADINGNLGIAPNGTGTSLLNWLQVTSSTIGNIAIWYDQSGAGNNATQSIASQQPSIDAVNNLISFKTNLSSSTGLYSFILPNGTVPYNTPYTVITKHNSAVGAGATSTLPALLSSGSGSTGNANDFYINTTTANYATNSYVNSWYGNDYYTTSSTLLNGNVVSFNYSGGAYNTRGIYVNGTLQNVSYYGSASGVLNSTSENNYIGYGDRNNYFNGEMYYLYIFKSQLSYTDQNILEQTPFYVAALTGISATSIAATSVTLQWTQTYGYQYSIVSWSYSGTNYTSSQISYGTNIFNGFTGGNILLPNVSYTFTVTPYYYINTTGGPSNSASPVAITSSAVTSSSIITLPTVTLPATQALIFPTVTANSVTINWNAAGTPPTFSYVIVSWASSTSTNQNGTSYTTPSNPLTANTQYTFTVTPYNSAASPVAGTAQSASIYTLGTITSATASATGTTVSISWTGSYNTVTISWTGSGSGTYTTSSSATSSYQVTLSAGTYNFSVTPINAQTPTGVSGSPFNISPSVTIINTGGALTPIASSTQSISDITSTVLLAHFNGANNGINFTDSSQYGQTFSVFGNAILSNKIPPKFGTTSLYLPGGSYIQSGANIINNLGGADFTIEFWLYWTGLNQNPGFPQIILTNNNNGFATTGANVATNSWLIGLSDYNNGMGTKLCFQIYSQTYMAQSILQTNTWTHYAIVRSSTSLLIFVNGILELSAPITGFIDDANTPRSITIGCGFNNQYLYGYLSDLRIMTKYGKYTSNFTVPDDTFVDNYDSNTVLLMHCDGTNNGTTIIDSSYYNNSFTPTGSPVTSTTYANFNGSSLYLNGSSYLTVTSQPYLSFGYNDWTIEFWLYLTSGTTPPSTIYLLSNSTTPSSLTATTWRIGLNSNAIAFIQNSTWATQSANYTTGAWVHYAFVRQATNILSFVNGTLTGNTSYYSSINTLTDNGISSPILIGGNLTGYIDEIRITRGTAIYTVPFNPPVMPFTLKQNIVPSDPITLLMHFEGSTFIDSSSYGNIIKTSGGSPSISTTYQAFGTSSGYFNGSSYITVPTSNNFAFGNGDFTIEFWIYRTSVVNNLRIFSNAYQASWASNMWVIGTNSGTFFFQTYNNGGSVYAPTSNAINTWEHYAFCRNGLSMLAFRNGIMQCNNNYFSTTTTDAGTTYPINIGWSAITGDSYYTGYIDELCITKGIARYTANFQMPNAPNLSSPQYDISNAATVLLLHNDGINVSQGFFDSSYYATALTPNNTVISSAQYKFGTGSSYYNGTNSYLQAGPITTLGLASNDFTIEFWMYPTNSASSGQILVSNATGAFATNTWYIGTSDTTGTLKVYIYNNSSSTVFLSGTTKIINKTWTHYALVRYGNLFTQYINGNKDVTAMWNGTMDGGGSQSIYFGTGNSKFFIGYLDEMRITKYARYTSQYFTIPSSQFTPTGVPLPVTSTLLLHFDGGSFFDSSVNAVSLSISTTAPTLITSTPSPASQIVASFIAASSTSIQTPSSYLYWLGTNNFTIEFYLNATSWSSSASIIGNLSAAFAANMWYIGGSVSNTIGLYVYNISGTKTLLQSITNIVTGTWYHIAVVRIANTWCLYINGIIEASVYSPLSIDNSTYTAQTISIGYNGNTNYYTGLLDELRLSNGFARYISNFTIPQYNLSSVVPVNDIPSSAISLLMHYDGANNGTTFTDSSYYNNTSIVTSAVLSNTYARFGSTSAYFNGSAYITLASSSGYAFGAEDFTIEFWLYTTSPLGASAARIMGNCSGSFGTNNWYIFNNAGSLAFQTYNNTNNLTVNTANVGGVWEHYAFCRCGPAMYAFRNGIMQCTNNYFTISAAAQLTDGGSTYPLTIGWSGVNTDTKFTGYIDEVRVIKGYAIYINNFNVATSPYSVPPIYDISPAVDTLLLHFDGTFTDASYYANTVTATNATISTTQNKFGGSSGNFNGTSAYISTTGVGLGYNDFTLEAWLYPSAITTSTQKPFSNGLTSQTNNWSIGTGTSDTSGKLKVYIYNYSSTVPLLTGLIALANNTWYHYALVRYGNTFMQFINGILDVSAIFNGSIDGGALQTYYLGIGNTGQYYSGYIDETRLTVGLARYKNNFASPITTFSEPQTSATTLLLHFDGPNGSTNIVDSSPYTNTISAYNYAQITTANCATGGSCLQSPSNGSGYIQVGSSLRNNLGCGDFTIEFWFNWNGVFSSAVRLMSNYSTTWASNYWIIGFTSLSAATCTIAFQANNINTFYGSTTIIQANTWYHFAISRQSNTFYAFLNGALQNTYFNITTTVDDGVTSRILNIGGNPGDTGQYYYGLMDEVRITKGFARYTATFILPTREYNTLTSPLVSAITPGVIYALDNLSPSAINSAQGLYAVVRLFAKYTGPTLNIRRSTDNYTLDFYADHKGNLGTYLNGSGISLTQWLGGATGYITTWYDQSGAGNNATQSTLSSQPTYNITAKVIDFGTSLYMNLPNGTIPTGDSSYTITFQHGAITSLSGNSVNGIFGSGLTSFSQNLSGLVTAITGSSGYYSNYWWSNDAGSTTTNIAAGNVVSFTYTTGAGTNSRSIYVNSVLNNQNTPSAIRNSTSANNYIGLGDKSNNNYLNGQLYFISFFNTNLLSNDRIIVEGITPTNSLAAAYDMTNALSYSGNTSPCKFDGLSSVATTSANGIYALVRAFTAYNGPTINVRRSSDNSTQDFYADVNGNFGTSLNATGISLDTWLSGATAYIRIWYDQSGSGNHAIQQTSSVQPTYNIPDGCIDFRTNANSFFILPPSTVPYNNVPSTVIYRNGIVTSGGERGILCGGTMSANNANIYYLDSANNYSQSQYGSNVSIGSYSIGNVVSYVATQFSTANTFYLYVNNGTPAVSLYNGSGSSATNGNGGFIGNDVMGSSRTSSGGATAGQNPFNGELYFITIFKSALSTIDRNIVESLGKNPAQTVVSDLSGNNRNIVFNQAPSYSPSTNTIVSNTNIGGSTKLPYNIDMQTNGFTTESVFLTSSSTYQAQTVAGFENAMEYPPAALTSASTTLTSGTYAITQSTGSGYLAFDKTTNGGSSNTWVSNGGSYSSITGAYTANTNSKVISGITYYGEWLQIQLPTYLSLSSYAITARSDLTTYSPNAWYLAGSNDGSTWTLVDSQGGQTFGLSQKISYIISSKNVNSYQYYLILVTNIVPSSGITNVAINELQLYGYNTTLPYVVNGLVGYYDFSNSVSYTASSTNIYDLSGNNNNLILTAAVPLSSSPGYATFTTQSARLPNSNLTSFAPTGITLEVLIKQGTAGISQRIFGIDNGASATDDYVSISTTSTNNTIGLSTSAPSTYYLTNATSQYLAGGWVHIVYTINPYINGSAMMASYVNGANTYNSSIISLFTTTNYVQIFLAATSQGTTNTYNGLIGLARIYNRPLSAGEVLQNFNSIVQRNNNPYSLGLEYPPTAMTSLATTISGQTYGNGTYTATGSTTLAGYNAYGAFDKANTSSTANAWATSTASYSTGNISPAPYTGAVSTTYITTSGSSSNVLGEYINLQLPVAILLTAYRLVRAVAIGTDQYNQCPYTWYILGSNDGSTFYQLDYKTGYNNWSSSLPSQYFTITNTITYSSYRIVINAIQGTTSTSYGHYASIGEWRLFGTYLTLTSAYGLQTAITTGATYKYPPVPISSTNWIGIPNTAFFVTTVSDQPYGNGLYTISSSTTWGGYSNYNATLLFDGIKSSNPTSFYYVSGSAWIQIQLPQQIILTSYTLNPLDPNPAPTSWNIQASNDGVSWVNLSTVSVSLGGTHNTGITTYLTTNNTPYCIYLLNITGGNYLKQWQLFTNVAPGIQVTNNYTNANTASVNLIPLEYPPYSSASSFTGITSAASNSISVTAAYGTGSYITSQSSYNSSSGVAAWCLFNKDSTTTTANNKWYCSSTTVYTGSGGAYNAASPISTTVSGSAVNGEWVQIKLPKQILLSSYIISIESAALGDAPNKWVLAGSNDGSTWYTVNSQGQSLLLPWTSLSSQTINAVYPGAGLYSYYRLIIQNTLNTTPGDAHLTEWRLFGAQLQSFTTSAIPASGYSSTNILGNVAEYPPSATTTLGTEANWINIASGNQYSVYLSGLPYGNGVYTCNASSQDNSFTWYSWKGFNKNNSDQWAIPSGLYNTSTGNYTGSISTITTNGGTLNGEWLQILLPYPISLNYYSLTTRSNAIETPYSWSIIASNNAIQWDVLHTITYVFSNSVQQTINFTPSIVTNSYTYYRIVVTNALNTYKDGYLAIAQFVLYGTQTQISTTTTIPINSWTHGALTVTSTGIWTWYLNGIASGGGNGFTIPPNIARYLVIGDYAGISGVIGGIALSRLYNRVLTNAQIAQNFALIANDLNINAQLIDIAGNFLSINGVLPTIPNASFESPTTSTYVLSATAGTITGWTTTSTSGLITQTSATTYVINTITIPNGKQCLLLTGISSSASTTISGLTIGASYRISFYVACAVGATITPTITVTVGSTTVITIAANNIVSVFVQWTTNAWTATANAMTLTIATTSASSAYVFIDNLTIAFASNSISLATIHTPTILNSSFEITVPPLASAAYGKAGFTTTVGTINVPGWTFIGNSGIVQTANTTYNPPTPITGFNALYLQSTTAIPTASATTTITGLTIGQTYAISCYIAYRTANSAGNLIITANGAQIYSISSVPSSTYIPISTTPWVATTVSATLVLSITTNVGGDSTTFVDLLTISPNNTQALLTNPIIENPSFEILSSSITSGTTILTPTITIPGWSVVSGQVGIRNIAITIYPLDGLSAIAKTYLRGCYSLKALFTQSAQYPVVQVQNSAATVTQTFYGISNTTTNLTTGPFGTGTTLASWISTNGTAYVSIWYDQSYYVNGASTQNNATSSGSARPIINTTTIPWCVDGTTNNTYFNLVSGTIVGNSTYTFSAKTNALSGSNGILGAGTINNTGQTNGFRFWNANGKGYNNFWWSQDTVWQAASALSGTAIGTIINYVSGISPTVTSGVVFTGGTTATLYANQVYINGQLPSTNQLTTNGSTLTTYTTRSNWNFQPGNDVLMSSPGSTGSLQGQMYWAFISSQALSTNDRLVVENIDNIL